MNYLGESELNPDLRSIIERLAALEANQPVEQPASCVLQNVNPLAPALFGSALGEDAIVRPFLASVPFNLPDEWPIYFFRASTPNMAVYANNACRIGLDDQGWYSVYGTVTISPNVDCHLQVTYSSYIPGQALGDWATSSIGDDRVCVAGTKYDFQFTDVAYFNAGTVVELSISNVNSTTGTVVSVYKYSLGMTKV